jgi:hypothetical protein
LAVHFGRPPGLPYFGAEKKNQIVAAFWRINQTRAEGEINSFLDFSQQSIQAWGQHNG